MSPSAISDNLDQKDLSALITWFKRGCEKPGIGFIYSTEIGDAGDKNAIC